MWACMAGGMNGERGAYMAGGIHDRGCAWWGACMAEGMCGKGRCAWQGWVSVVREACMAGVVHSMLSMHGGGCAG